MPENRDLLGTQLGIINAGLEVFAETLEIFGIPVVQVDWRPPAEGGQRMVDLLSRLEQGRPAQSGTGPANTSSDRT